MIDTLFLHRNSPVPAGEQELKFLIPAHAAAGMRRWLGTVLQPHRTFEQSTICSIYFDTASRQSFREKEASDHRKTKYRLRWYADAQGVPLKGPAFMEIKEKQGAARRKHRIPLHIPAAQLADTPLTDPLFEGLFQRCAAHGAPKPDVTLRPMLELRYERRRYRHAIFPETFCLDSNIRCKRVHPASLPQAHGRPLDFCIFEQKGSSQHPQPILQALPRFGARRASFSKYFLAVLQLQPDMEIA
jgi:hypothetical protein